jgi:hypothetical protein
VISDGVGSATWSTTPDKSGTFLINGIDSPEQLRVATASSKTDETIMVFMLIVVKMLE